MAMKITTNADQVASVLKGIATKQIPYAMMVGVNKLADDIVYREQEEMSRVFDRPTPFIIKGLRVTQRATKKAPTAVVGFKNVYGRRGGAAIEEVLMPHMPEGGGVRSQRNAERWLTRNGWMLATEYLVPSRTCPRDRYGNVTAALWSKMLQDVGAYRTAVGYNHTTKTRNTRRTRKAQYMFGSVGKVRGIWKIGGGRDNYARGSWTLMMRVVSKVSYRPRFDFYGVAKDYADKHLADAVGAGVARAIATARPEQSTS